MLSPVDGFHPSPPFWSLWSHANNRATGRPALHWAVRGPPGCPPTPNADMGAGRGQGAGEQGVRVWGYVPALPCRVQCRGPSAQHGTGTGTLYLFASPLALPQIQYGAHRPKPSARQTRKTPRRLYQPRGPPTLLIPADSPFALMFPRHSCDIYALAALHPHGSNLANTRSSRPPSTPLPPTACLGTSRTNPLACD